MTYWYRRPFRLRYRYQTVSVLRQINEYTVNPFIGASAQQFTELTTVNKWPFLTRSLHVLDTNASAMLVRTSSVRFTDIFYHTRPEITVMVDWA